MKLNFWQWLGVALLVVGLILFITRQTGDTPPTTTTPQPTPATQPAPATQPGQS